MEKELALWRFVMYIRARQRIIAGAARHEEGLGINSVLRATENTGYETKIRSLTWTWRSILCGTQMVI